jgi:hypothetical protein
VRRALLAALGVLALASCGGERTFSAEEFIEEANSHHAGLVLAEPLDSLREGVEVYELQFAGGGSPSESDGPVDAHGGGTLAITEDSDAGAAEFERCEAAASLICFRAANAALYFEGALAPADLARVEDAIRAMGAED